MKQRESFVVYHSTLYAHARKIYKEPLHSESGFPKMVNLNFLPDSLDEGGLFVVDWEIQDTEKRERTDGYALDTQNDIFSFIADW